MRFEFAMNGDTHCTRLIEAMVLDQVVPDHCSGPPSTIPSEMAGKRQDTTHLRECRQSLSVDELEVAQDEARTRHTIPAHQRLPKRQAPEPMQAGLSRFSGS